MSAFHIILLNLLAALWGGSFLFLRIATPELGEFTVIATRIWIATIFLLPIWWVKFGKTKAQRALLWQNKKQIAYIGMLNSAIPFLLFAYAIHYLSSGFTSILNSTAAIWGVIVAWVWLKKRPSLSVGIGLVIGIIGVIVLVQKNISLDFSGQTKGVVAALVAALMYGFCAHYVQEKAQHIPSFTIATFSLVFASIVLIIPTWWYFPTHEVSQLAWISALLLGVFCTGIANWLYFYLIDQVTASKAICVAFLIPIFGVLWGVVFLQETVSISIILGMLLILLGTALVIGLLKYPNYNQPCS